MGLVVKAVSHGNIDQVSSPELPDDGAHPDNVGELLGRRPGRSAEALFERVEADVQAIGQLVDPHITLCAADLSNGFVD